MRKIDEIYNSMLGKGKPSPYIYYDYLESNGRQYISDIGMYNTLDSEYEVVFDTNESGWLFGNASLNGRADACGIACGSSGTIRFAQAYATGLNFVGKHHVIFNKSSYTIDDTQYQYAQAVTSVSSAVLLLFYAGGSANTFKGKMEYFIHRQSGVVVQDFRPAVRRADGVSGMHDVLNDVFKPSSTKVNFLYGNF